MAYIDLENNHAIRGSRPEQPLDATDGRVVPFYSNGSTDNQSQNELTQLEKVSSRFSEQNVYHDMDEEEIALQRQKTVASVVSRAEHNSLYRESSHIEMTGNDEMPSGKEFENIDPELVTWDSDSDPKDPRNWPRKMKWTIIFLTSLQSIVPTYTSSAMAPVIPNVLTAYNNSNKTVGSLMDSIVVLVWGVSCMMWAPLSEVFGRRAMMISTAFVNLGMSIGCALSPNTTAMLVFRCFSGVFDSITVAVGGGIIGDIYDEQERQWPLAFWDLTPTCGPAIAPIISAWIAEKTVWNWAFWCIVILQGVSLVLMVFFFWETYPRVILHKKKLKLQKLTGNMNLHTIWDLTKQPFWVQVKLAILRPIYFLVLNPVVLLLSVYMAYTYGFMYLILNDFPNLWTDVYGYSPGIGGLMYIGYFVGTVLGVFVWTSLINWWYDRQHAKGKGKMEDRLFMLPFSVIFFAAGMFWYGWSAEAKLHWIMPTIGIGIFSFSVFCAFQSVQSYLVSLNVALSGSILAACLLFRSFLGGTFPLFGDAMYNHLGYGWASTATALMALALGVPWPIGIYIYGPQLRQWVDDHIHIH